MRQVVKCLILNKFNEFLLIKRASDDSHANLWETPGGGVEDTDASFLDACIRETFEECGLRVNPFYKDSDIFIDDETGEQFVVHLYESYSDDTPNLDDNQDHTDYAWVNNTSAKTIDIDSWSKIQIEMHLNTKIF